MFIFLILFFNIRELCKDLFKKWSELDDSSFSVETVSGGITNLCECYYFLSYFPFELEKERNKFYRQTYLNESLRSAEGICEGRRWKRGVCNS